MIDHTLRAIGGAVNAELVLATKDHGKYFHSPHEGYGVLMEEVWEAQMHTGSLSALADNLLMLLHHVEDSPDAYIRQLDKIKDQALHGAAELCQVAAMCEKGMRSMRNNRKE